MKPYKPVLMTFLISSELYISSFTNKCIKDILLGTFAEISNILLYGSLLCAIL